MILVHLRPLLHRGCRPQLGCSNKQICSSSSNNHSRLWFEEPMLISFCEVLRGSNVMFRELFAPVGPAFIVTLLAECCHSAGFCQKLGIASPISNMRSLWRRHGLNSRL